jgi:hypothetical protein
VIDIGNIFFIGLFFELLFGGSPKIFFKFRVIFSLRNFFIRNFFK